MKIRICSDLHSEFWVTNQAEAKTKIILERFALPIMPNEDETVLVIAGDLGSLHNFKQQKFILGLLSERFKAIIICGGNHEWYGGDYVIDAPRYAELYEGFGNIFTNYSTVLSGINFITTTLWTNFNNQNPFDMLAVQQGMNDFSQIKFDGERLTPNHLLTEHQVNLVCLQECLEKSKGKTVVVTHHAPSFKSIPVVYQTSKINSGYASDLEYLFGEYDINLWIHGHTHEAKDYYIGKTRIVSNPFGYRLQEKTGYNPELTIEI